MAQEHSAAYLPEARPLATVPSEANNRPMPSVEFDFINANAHRDVPHEIPTLSPLSKNKCFFCGHAYHKMTVNHGQR